MSPIVQLQRRMMELGRCRLGQKGTKGEPKKLDTFRWTSASRDLLEAIAAKDGGTVQEWKDAPDDGYFELVSDSGEIDIIIPPVFSQADGSPTTAYSQWFELWSAGGCQRRCDGQTEALTGKPCLCAAKVEQEGEDARECKITTRFSFMRPDIPGLGVWRLDSHGWNAATELGGTLEVLMMAAAEHKFIPARLRIEHRSRKMQGQTRRFVVPVVDLPGVTVQQLAAGEAPTVLNAPSVSRERPALPSGPAPAGERLETASPPLGEQPPLPDDPGSAPAATGSASAGESAASGASTEWATEKDITDLLEIAARIDNTTHDKVVDAVAKHRQSHSGLVDAKWLKRQTDRLLAKAAV